jgi:hypothetical protein
MNPLLNIDGARIKKSDAKNKNCFRFYLTGLQLQVYQDRRNPGILIILPHEYAAIVEESFT